MRLKVETLAHPMTGLRVFWGKYFRKYSMSNIHFPDKVFFSGIIKEARTKTGTVDSGGGGEVRFFENEKLHIPRMTTDECALETLGYS